MLNKLILCTNQLYNLTFVSNIFITKRFNYEEKNITLYSWKNRRTLTPCSVFI